MQAAQTCSLSQGRRSRPASRNGPRPILILHCLTLLASCTPSGPVEQAPPAASLTPLSVNENSTGQTSPVPAGTAKPTALPATDSELARAAEAPGRATDAPSNTPRAEVGASLEPILQDFTTAQMEQALRRGRRSRASIGAWTLEPSPTLWKAPTGVVYRVRVGDSVDGSVVKVARGSDKHGWTHAASLLLTGDHLPIALATSKAEPERLLWSSCWGCGGEGGSIRLDAAGKPVISPQ